MTDDATRIWYHTLLWCFIHIYLLHVYLNSLALTCIFVILLFSLLVLSFALSVDSLEAHWRVASFKQKTKDFNHIRIALATGNPSLTARQIWFPRNTRCSWFQCFWSSITDSGWCSHLLQASFYESSFTLHTYHGFDCSHTPQFPMSIFFWVTLSVAGSFVW